MKILKGLCNNIRYYSYSFDSLFYTYEFTETIDFIYIFGGMGHVLFREHCT
jgi:hypothetical protein